MRRLLLLSPFFLGASLNDNILNDLIPDVDFDNEDCIGDACFPRQQVLMINHARTDPTNKLKYNERSIGYARTKNLLDACLPGVNKENVAGSFTSCKGKMEDVCTFAKRGWLMKDSQDETVANADLLKKLFSGIEGGEAAVKTCLKLKEEEAVDDDYWYYDYDYYYDDAYDYLEEGDNVEVRKKREAGNGRNGGKKENKANKGKGKKRNGRKGTGNRKGKAKSNNKKGGKGNKKNVGKERKNGKGKERNGGKGKGKARKNKNNKDNNKKNKKPKKGNNDDRKFVKNTEKNKKPTKEKEAKIDKRLQKLGLTKIPKKSTLSGLECMWEELENLLLDCGEKIIANSP